uniref:Uncharacterized protein n=1 Tax=Fusarium oxysporum (strain Fo5176) TaxID=660025 RepID=A0A0D2YD02_FUSOF
MSNEQGRLMSKRLAAAAATDYEHDDDFSFVRKSKRIKTDVTDEPKPEAVPEPKAEPVKKSAKGRPVAKQRAAKAPTTNGTSKDYKMRRRLGKQYENHRLSNRLSSPKARLGLLFYQALICWIHTKARSEDSWRTRQHHSTLFGLGQNQGCGLFSRHSSFRSTNLPTTFTSSSSGFCLQAKKRIRSLVLAPYDFDNVRSGRRRAQEPGTCQPSRF